MNHKFLKKIYHMNLNLHLMRKNIIQINGGITINIYVGVKNVMLMKMIWQLRVMKL